MITYKDAGVDIHEAASLVDDIGELRRRTEKNRSLFQAFGLFAASYDLSSYNSPVIVTGCDGVGTKLELLLEYDLLETAGKDLVAMSVNDILTTGGDPLLFLDYVGVGHIDKTKIARLIAGMVDYLEACDCILAGGETAEMPGFVSDGMIELSGFCIGAAEKEDLIDPTTISEGDVVIGYESNGIHANGWSLVRRVIKEFPGEIQMEEMLTLLAPTRLYHDVVRNLREADVTVKGYSHITGGGLPENLQRLIPEKGADLVVPKWEIPGVQKLLAHCDPKDAFDTFNMGYGWVAIVAESEANQAVSCGPGGRELGRITLEPGVKVRTI